MPSPKWKLVVDVGAVSSYDSTGEAWEADSAVRELGDLISNQMPDDKNSPLAGLLPGFTSLRLLLLKANRTEREVVLLDKALSLYRQYKQSGHTEESLASMICGDFMQLSRQENIHNTIAGTQAQAASLRFNSTNENAVLSDQAPLEAHLQSATLYVNESQMPSVAQLGYQKHQQRSEQFVVHQPNGSQNHHPEALAQQGMQSNYAVRNGTLAGSNNDISFSVSPSLHALINSPFSQAIEGQSELQLLNLSSHSGAQHNRG